MSAINPLGTIISSGDDEAFSHPRADTLGMIGKCSRGERPGIFCTELARSAPGTDQASTSCFRPSSTTLVASLKKKLTPAEEKKVNASIANLKKSLERSVAVFGAINLRTDGTRAVVAQDREAEKSRHRVGYLQVRSRDRRAAS